MSVTSNRLEADLAAARERNRARLAGMPAPAEPIDPKQFNPRDGRFPDVVRIYREAGGKCAICGKQRGARNHALDHCHKTNKLRGVLCAKCNIGIGYFDDDINKLRQAIAYLERHAE